MFETLLMWPMSLVDHRPALGTLRKLIDGIADCQACRGYEIIHPYPYPNPQIPMFSNYFSFDSHAPLMTFECGRHMRRLSTVRQVTSSQCSYHVIDHVLWGSLVQGFGVRMLDLCKPSIAVFEPRFMLGSTYVTWCVLVAYRPGARFSKKS